MPRPDATNARGPILNCTPVGARHLVSIGCGHLTALGSPVSDRLQVPRWVARESMAILGRTYPLGHQAVRVLVVLLVASVLEWWSVSDVVQQWWLATAPAADQARQVQWAMIACQAAAVVSPAVPVVGPV